ncbi:MAG: preprotein translocase subunit YajC [Planctomycetota bacterium]|nr:MAG: preprotein translocase subunit YajC [Planctomycetota bacterium]
MPLPAVEFEAPAPAGNSAATQTPAESTETGTPIGPPGGDEGSSAASPFQPLLIFGLFFVFMWFVLIRPERKRSKQRQAMLAQAGKGDHVVTTGGIHGVIVRVEEKTLTLKVDDNLRLKFDRNAIGRILSSKSGGGEAAPAAKSGKDKKAAKVGAAG